MPHTIRVERADHAFADFTKDTPWTTDDINKLKTLPQMVRFIDNKMVFADQMNKELEQAGLSLGAAQFQGLYRAEVDSDENMEGGIIIP